MKIGLITLLIAGFFSVVVLRTGMMLSESEAFLAFAADTPDNGEPKAVKKGLPQAVDLTKKMQDATKNSGADIQTRLSEPSDDETKSKDFNAFALKTEKPEIMDNDTVCITGPVLISAKKKLAYLEKREQEIKEQERLIEIADRRVREQVAKLKLIKDQVVEQAQLADSKIAQESKRLISIYEKMKPKEAANIFNEMSPAVAAELLRSMKEDQSSAILAKMLPKTAYEVTLALAGNIKGTEDKYKKLK